MQIFNAHTVRYGERIEEATRAIMTMPSAAKAAALGCTQRPDRMGRRRRTTEIVKNATCATESEGDEMSSMTTDQPEKDLYEPVQAFVRRKFDCFATAINVGISHSRIDVVGIRDIGGDLTGRDEVIAVEVKRGTQPFATCAGQTVGYSIFADQCYLAEYRPKKAFTPDEEAIARHLGIGLIRIRNAKQMEVVLTAPTKVAIDRLRTMVCERL